MGLSECAVIRYAKGRWKLAAAVGVVVIVAVGIAVRLWPRHVEPSKTTVMAVNFVGGSKDMSRRGDVVFVHGLGGDARTTWQREGCDFFWPTELGKRFPDLGVWSIAYAASPSDWLGSTMPIADRSKNLLEELRVRDIGKKPLVFIGHSLGGIIIKKMLQHAFTLKNPAWEELGNNTKGVVFLATPHSGSDYAQFFYRLNSVMPIKASVTLRELEPNTPDLRDLGDWYRDDIPNRKISTAVFYESKPVAGFSTLIVDEASCNPGLSGVTPIRVDADHLSICKPTTDQDLVYLSVGDFISQHLVPVPHPFPISFAQFAKDFNDVRRDPARLSAFKKDHVDQKVTWIAYVKKVLPDDEVPAYWIAPAINTVATDQVLANFLPEDFSVSLQENAKVSLEGTLTNGTNSSGAVLDKCRILRREE